MSSHHATRPSWLCGGCGGPWPCPTSQRELLAEFDGAYVPLSLYMSAHLADAAGDLGFLPTAELYQRFIGWVRAAYGPFR
jgi:hypothetical protein